MLAHLFTQFPSSFLLQYWLILSNLKAPSKPIEGEACPSLPHFASCHWEKKWNDQPYVSMSFTFRQPLWTHHWTHSSRIKLSWSARWPWSAFLIHTMAASLSLCNNIHTHLSTHTHQMGFDVAFNLQFAFKEFSYSTFRYAPSIESILIKHKLVDGA